MRDGDAAVLRELVDAYERGLIEVALAAAGGSQCRAAAALGILPSTLHQKLRRLGIPTAREMEGVRAAEPENGHRRETRLPIEGDSKPRLPAHSGPVAARH